MLLNFCWRAFCDHLAAVDASRPGPLPPPLWRHTGVEFAYASPVLDGDRLYILDGGGLSISANATMTGTGVMFYNTSITQGAGSISLKGTAGEQYVV